MKTTKKESGASTPRARVSTRRRAGPGQEDGGRGPEEVLERGVAPAALVETEELEGDEDERRDDGAQLEGELPVLDEGPSRPT